MDKELINMCILVVHILIVFLSHLYTCYHGFLAMVLKGDFGLLWTLFSQYYFSDKTKKDSLVSAPDVECTFQSILSTFDLWPRGAGSYALDLMGTFFVLIWRCIRMSPIISRGLSVLVVHRHDDMHAPNMMDALTSRMWGPEGVVKASVKF